MKNGRLGLRLPARLLEEVKAYAEKKNTTISSLVEKCLEDLIEAERQSKVSETMDAEQV
jgi:hypothetical protein